jgi:DeoR family transcriptional regulator, aga operon transcriptional repressor
MSTKNRLDQIKKFIEQNQRVDIEEISREFDISTATARRDLDQLSEEGLIQRIHGGATALRKAPPELPVHLRGIRQAEEKACIGRVAAGLINDGDTILMEGGTTVYEVAKNLFDKKNITVITNSIMVANIVSDQPEINLFVLGGFLRRSEQITYGLYTEQILSDLYVDKVFMGVRSISPRRGIALDFLPDLSTERLFLKKGKEVIIVADHTKFMQEATTTIGRLSDIHHIVTDNKTPEDIITDFRNQGIDIIVASGAEQGFSDDVNNR